MQLYISKKSKDNWTIDEVEKILKTISNEDVEDFLDDMVFEKCFPGKLMDSKQFENGWDGNNAGRKVH